MKRIIALFLSCLLMLTGCNTNESEPVIDADVVTQDNSVETDMTEENKDEAFVQNVRFSGLDDAELLVYVEDTVYSELITELDDEEYFIENVDAVYISKEYLEEIEYNSQENIFFGYTLSELEEQFQGTRYVFALGEDGQTTVQALEEVYDDTYDQIIKNVAIGSGVILVCVTVSLVSGGLGAPAVSMIFATSAKTGTVLALSSGGISGVAAGLAKGYQTNDFEQAMKAGALAASENFKWGAIIGSTAGGIEEGVALKGATLNGLTMNEAAAIQQESKYPLDVIKQFKSYQEYEIYKNAGLKTSMVSGKLALVRDIDLKFKSELPDGTVVTNLERMQKGYPPLDPTTGKAYQLHHINQDSNGTLAVLTTAEHQGNAGILNTAGKASEIDRTAFEKIKKAFWQSFAESFN